MTVPVGRTFFSSFLAGEPAARGFLARDFRDPELRNATVRDAATRRASPAIVEVLRAQGKGLPPSAARDANLAALSDGGTAVVATGQQVGLFLGPLYSFYKAASAVAAARALQAASGVRCVPLFWLQTEDHDFVEIATCRILGHDGAIVSLSLAPEPAEQARVSIAHRRLGPEVTGIVDALADALGTAPAAADVAALLRAEYVPDRPVAAAFAGVLATLFADDGLLVLDPRDARIARAAAPLYARALDQADVVEAALRARGAALTAAGLDQQVPVRDGCALLFFHPRGAEGPRFRLRRVQRAAAGARWELAGASDSLSDADVRAMLARDPLRFSTSALLRPLLQDTLLPTAAYVGGPAEVSYFAQLGPVYDVFGLPQPLVIPRGRFRVVDIGTRRRLTALGLRAADTGLAHAELVSRVDARHAPGAAAASPEALRRRVAEGILPTVDELARAIVDADPAAARAATRTRATVERALGRLVDRYARDLLARDGVASSRLDKIQRALCPDGIPQERFYAWPSLAARHGVAAFKELVMERLARAPFPTEIEELEA